MLGPYPDRRGPGRGPSRRDRDSETVKVTVTVGSAIRDMTDLARRDAPWSSSLNKLQVEPDSGLASHESGLKFETASESFMIQWCTAAAQANFKLNDTTQACQWPGQRSS